MKNNWLTIKSQGEIEIGALTLLGASTKRADETKIGYFGSGLKYTMALLLRKNVPFCIYQGDKELVIGKEQTNFRDQEFSQIVVDGKVTSFTTEMGVDWLPWMAIRELYSNALDEPNCIMDHGVNRPSGESGWTTIGIFLNEEFTDFAENPGLYFSDFRDPNEVLYQKGGAVIYAAGKERVVYRKGIRAYFRTEECLYHYDFPKADLTETRTLKHEGYVLGYDVANLLTTCDDINIIRNIIDRVRYSEEVKCDWNRKGYSEVWIDALQGRWVIAAGTEDFLKNFLSEPHVILPQTMVSGLRSSFGDKIKIAGYGDSDKQYLPCDKLSDRNQGVLESAVLFVKDAGIEINYKIEVVDFMDKKILGLAHVGKHLSKDWLGTETWEGDGESKILISRQTLERGVKECVATLLEENAHLESGLSDETRGFQNHLINQCINVMESKVGRYL